jgi:uncharacterized protein (DUF1330 family)
MPAYFIVDLDIREPTGFQAYARAVGPVLEKFGARYLVAGEAGNVVEVGGRLGSKEDPVIEFPSSARKGVFRVTGVSRGRWTAAQVGEDEPDPRWRLIGRMYFSVHSTQRAAGSKRPECFDCMETGRKAP